MLMKMQPQSHLSLDSNVVFLTTTTTTRESLQTLLSIRGATAHQRWSLLQVLLFVGTFVPSGVSAAEGGCHLACCSSNQFRSCHVEFQFQNHFLPGHSKHLFVLLLLFEVGKKTELLGKLQKIRPSARATCHTAT